MDIAGVKPRQLAPTMGTTGSGSMNSPAPSSTATNLTASTRFDGPSSAMAVDSASPFDIDPLTINFDTNDKININSAINIAVGIAVPAIINTNDKIDVDSTINTAVGIAVPSIIDTNPPKTEVRHRWIDRHRHYIAKHRRPYSGRDHHRPY
jgi:hypothetical protein